ncbi:PepSY-associated TM helix domain-containing protein [Spirosoma flavum]|uniref:PepSY-associated TM helix domain-containing protein n=1 Tax=Spirosoma flavum TaxID=2048557 RepID=A0ABW6AQI5_9BACT
MSKSQPQPWITARNQRLTNGQPGSASTNPPQPVRGLRWAGLVRWLHLYLSVVSFVLVLFFAVTGLTLNHADWFDGASITNEFRGRLNPAWVKGADTITVDKLALVEYLRSAHRIRGAVSDVRIDDREVSISFRGPGYTTDAFIRRPVGTYQLTETNMGLVAVLNDLHKGRDTGRSWAWVIDVAAVFMTLVSVTGLLLMLVLKKRRVSGLGWLLAGAIASGLAYWWLVV